MKDLTFRIGICPIPELWDELVPARAGGAAAPRARLHAPPGALGGRRGLPDLRPEARRRAEGAARSEPLSRAPGGGHGRAHREAAGRAHASTRRSSLVTGADMWRTPAVSRASASRSSRSPTGPSARAAAPSAARSRRRASRAARARRHLEPRARAKRSARRSARRRAARAARCCSGRPSTCSATRSAAATSSATRRIRCSPREIGVAWIRGVQRQGVGACVKHYVCNDSEFERHTISSDVGDRAAPRALPAALRARGEARPGAGR